MLDAESAQATSGGKLSGPPGKPGIAPAVPFQCRGTTAWIPVPKLKGSIHCNKSTWEIGDDFFGKGPRGTGLTSREAVQVVLDVARCAHEHNCNTGAGRGG